MIEKAAAEAPDNLVETITAYEVADYIFDLSGELAAMADHHGFGKIAAALELARTLAGEAAAAGKRQPGQHPPGQRQPGQHQPGSENAAPDDAA